MSPGNKSEPDMPMVAHLAKQIGALCPDFYSLLHKFKANTLKTTIMNTK